MESRRILVVDDYPDIVLYLASLLEDHGYELRTASDSRSALTVLESFQPDAILVDVLMPGRSGLDLLVTLRRDPRWEHVAIVVITDTSPPSLPCGLCLQCLSELAAPDLPVRLVNPAGESRELRLDELLPHPFVLPPGDASRPG